ncbi:MAG: methyltransferase domain-containing protein [Promethearchaeota archaeon]
MFELSQSSFYYNPPKILDEKLKKYLRLARFIQKKILLTCFKFIIKYFKYYEVRNTQLFREWFFCPMNYVRIMEIPLTFVLLRASKADKILDLSSPKILSLYYNLLKYPNIIASDIEDYFVKDFEVFSKFTGLNMKTAIFDITKGFPFPENSFDRIFSISVLEHIPYEGDKEALKQILHYLKPSGIAVITLPAFHKYIEEWVYSKNFYWNTVKNKNGAYFYQRRYNLNTIISRFKFDNGYIDRIIFIAEKPIKKTRLNNNGLLLHNSYYINTVFIANILNKMRNLKIPLCRYFAANYVSHKCHYLTYNGDDKNIRQVIVRIRKNA